MITRVKQLIRHIVLRLKYKDIWIHHSAVIGANSVFEGANKIHPRAVFNGELGFCSYIAPDCQIFGKIGRFVSIAPNCKTLLGVHPYTYPHVSTSPVFFSLMGQCILKYSDRQIIDEFRYADVDKKYPVIIGNDCWIQTGAMIMSGVKIGDGAVILAGAVVTKDVPPYAIVGGVPAKVMRYRYTPEDIEFLLGFRWWDKDRKWLRENWRLMNSIEDLKAYANNM